MLARRAPPTVTLPYRDRRQALGMTAPSRPTRRTVPRLLFVRLAKKPLPRRNRRAGLLAPVCPYSTRHNTACRNAKKPCHWYGPLGAGLLAATIVRRRVRRPKRRYLLNDGDPRQGFF